jgi:hypothetical protein
MKNRGGDVLFMVIRRKTKFDISQIMRRWVNLKSIHRARFSGQAIVWIDAMKSPGYRCLGSPAVPLFEPVEFPM